MPASNETLSPRENGELDPIPLPRSFAEIEKHIEEHLNRLASSPLTLEKLIVDIREAAFLAQDAHFHLRQTKLFRNIGKDPA